MFGVIKHYCQSWACSVHSEETCTGFSGHRLGLGVELSDSRLGLRLGCQRTRYKLENVSTANALQLEAGRRRADPIRFYTSSVASLKTLSLSAAVLERIYCLYVTLRCDLEL